MKFDTMYIIMALPTKKQNVLRPFIFIKRKVFSNEKFDKLKAWFVADGSQQGQHLYDFATVSLQVVSLDLLQ